jgi:hypothetical protein
MTKGKRGASHRLDPEKNSSPLGIAPMERSAAKRERDGMLRVHKWWASNY